MLERWWQHCLQAEGPPADLELVHRRLVRWVGRGALPDVGPVFVKVMRFPRPKDRLRYLLRPLPATHEAAMLAAVRAVGLAVPDVVAARAVRRAGLPRLSMLVTRRLEIAPTGDPDRNTMAIAMARLAAAGLFHPDLHPGNFVALREGGVALLDLQSMRRRRAPLPMSLRRRMAAKFLLHAATTESDRRSCCEPLVESGLLPHSDQDSVLAATARMGQAEVLVRIRRCLMESTEFGVERSWRGTTYRRRSVPAGQGTWIEGGRELREAWIGDRVLEVVDGERPRLGALFLRFGLLLGKHRLYIPGQPPLQMNDLLQQLGAGYRRYGELRREVATRIR